MGFVINGIGPITAFIAAALLLSDSEAGLHSVGLALGLIMAGLTTARLDRVIGTARVHIAALVALGLSFVLLAWAPALAVTLVGAFGCGLGFGVMLAHINQTLTAGGGPLARVRTARGTLIAQIAGLLVPVVIAIGALVGLSWSIVVLPLLLLVALSLVFTRGRRYRPLPLANVSARLSRPYWTAWLLVVAVGAFESAITFWSSPLVERQAGVPLEEAALAFSAFLGGMIVSRFGLSLPAVGRFDPIVLMRIGLAGVVLGSLVAWASTAVVLSMAAFFAAGMASGVLFPLGLALTMETSPGQPQAASSRLVLGPGLGLLVTPLVLGMAADAVGVDVAWLMVPAICLVGLALTVPVARDRSLAAG